MPRDVAPSLAEYLKLLTDHGTHESLHLARSGGVLEICAIGRVGRAIIADWSVRWAATVGERAKAEMAEFARPGTGRPWLHLA